MHPELIAALATERRRDMTASATEHLSRPARRGLLPHYKLTWTHTSLGSTAAGSANPVAAGRRERSWVIVISATRAL
jgi:hypothetical protein